MSKRRFWQVATSSMLHWFGNPSNVYTFLELEPRGLEPYRNDLCPICLGGDPNYVDVEVKLGWKWVDEGSATVVDDENTSSSSDNNLPDHLLRCGLDDCATSFYDPASNQFVHNKHDHSDFDGLTNNNDTYRCTINHDKCNH